MSKLPSSEEAKQRCPICHETKDRCTDNEYCQWVWPRLPAISEDEIGTEIKLSGDKRIDCKLHGVKYGYCEECAFPKPVADGPAEGIARPEIAYKCRSCNCTLTAEEFATWVGCDVCEGESMVAVEPAAPVVQIERCGDCPRLWDTEGPVCDECPPLSQPTPVVVPKKQIKEPKKCLHFYYRPECSDCNPEGAKPHSFEEIYRGWIMCKCGRPRHSQLHDSDAQLDLCKCGHRESEHGVNGWNGDEYCKSNKCLCPRFTPSVEPRESSPVAPVVVRSEETDIQKQMNHDAGLISTLIDDVKRLRKDRGDWRRKYFEMEGAQSRSIDQNGEHIKRIQRLERDKDELRSEIKSVSAQPAPLPSDQIPCSECGGPLQWQLGCNHCGGIGLETSPSFDEVWNGHVAECEQQPTPEEEGFARWGWNTARTAALPVGQKDTFDEWYENTNLHQMSEYQIAKAAWNAAKGGTN